MITDSNGKYLNPQLLKPSPEAKVKLAQKFTVTEATDNVPSSENPESVTDLIFQVGLNDSRAGKSSEKICNDTLDMQMKYKQKFKNARQHIVALPPLSDKQIEVNGKLQKLANHTHSNFITTRAFRDRVTGQLRKNLMEDDIHYSNIGIKTLTHAIKKSIFSASNIGDGELDHMSKIRERRTPSALEPSL